MKKIGWMLFASVLLVGAKGCNDCEKAQAEAEAICAASGSASEQCIAARKHAAEVCAPTPEPTPTPEPPPVDPPPVDPPPVDPPVDPPPVATCPWPTPTARQALADGKAPTFNVQREGRKQITATPIATFGKEYYCAIGWTEACNEGKVRGPVGPDGPDRLPCEKVFMEANCPTFSMARCTGVGNQCPITFDPYFVIDGVNQNHPENVAAGCNGDDWVKVDGQVVKGMFWRATAHGKGTVQACNGDGTICGVQEVDQ
jgi:hypothetical protein